MGYSSIDDILDLLPESTLVEISNDDPGATAIDSEAIAAMIAKADSVIDGFVATRHEVPLSPVPGMIATISANLAVYFLYRKRSMVPEIWQEQYRADSAVLSKIAAGQISLGVSPGETKEPPGQTMTSSSPKKMGGSSGLLQDY